MNKSKNRTFSVLVETENLGMADLKDLYSSLDSLNSQAFPIDKINEVLLIVGGHVSMPVVKKLQEKYPWLKIHMERETLDYARSKVSGGKVAKSDVLIFADSDMVYEDSWLENMTKAINSSPSGTIVSGDTRLDTTSSYKMALNSTWMVQVLSDKMDEPIPTSFFPLNNFAIEKEVLTRIPIPNIPLYRNKIPIWERMLLKAGLKIVRAPGTRGYHAAPKTLGDWWYRMLIYGADFVAQSDFYVDQNGEVVERKNLTRRFHRFIFLFPWKVEQLFLNSYKLLKEDWRRIKYLPGSLTLGLINCLVIEIGALMALIDRDFIFRKITIREESHIV